jgi:hypothetical protein
MAQGGQRVRGFAGLRDDDHQRIGVGNARAVAVFARDLDVARDPGQVLDPLPADEARVVARAAGEHEHRLDSRQRLLRSGAEKLRADGEHALQRVAHRARLLEDFLLHEMAVRAELGRHAGGLDLAHFARHRVALQVDHLPRLLADRGDVAFLEECDAVGRAGERHRVGSEEMLVFPDADHERAAGARADHRGWVLLGYHRDRVRPLQPRRRAAHRVEQIPVMQAVHQVRDHLGVGLALEAVALRFQLRAQLVMVLDDAVVHDGDLAARDERMRVLGRRRAVRGPARVRDAGFSGLLLRLGRQVGNPRDGAREPDAVLAQERNAAGVVAPVLEPPQPFDQDRNDVAPCDGAHDAAHIRPFSSLPWVSSSAPRPAAPARS